MPTAAPATAPTSTLADYLENKLTARLLELEKKVGREKVREQMLGVLNPSSDAASNAFKEANDRVTELAKEIDKGKHFPWIHPQLSAAAFETVQSACVQCWLLAGDPANKNDLAPVVKEYIRLQTRLFTAAIGADRTTAAAASNPAAQ